jgi:hypothetical protein
MEGHSRKFKAWRQGELNYSLIIQRLIDKKYSQWELDEFCSLQRKLNESNIQVWKNEKRVIAVKAYSSVVHFLNWYEDQVIVSYIYDILDSKIKKNFYFLLYLDWQVEINSRLIEQVNVVEKDDMVCRKYVIASEEDLERVPFLQVDTIQLSEFFDYEKDFKEKLLIKSKEENNFINELINYYFTKDYFAESKEIRQGNIGKLLIRRDKI